MLKEDILQLLKAGKDTYLSGQRISAQLGVSRAAVWKAVEALRKDGYGIDSRSNCGYRLVRVPDVMTQEALSDTGTRQVGRRVLYYDSLDSTNNEIKRLSIDQVENGLAVIADCQTGGRGRRGRSFLSPAGKGLYLSVLMQPRCSVEELSMLTAWSAVALCSAVERACGVRPGIKWPNDLVMQNRKLCEHAASLRHMGNTHSYQLITRNLCDIVSFIGNSACLGRDQAGNGLQCCGFPCAVCSDQGNDLTLVYLK